MKKIITLTELRRFNAHVANGEISATKMVEIINERAKVANEKAEVININYFDKYRYEAELNEILHNNIFKLKKQIESLKYEK